MALDVSMILKLVDRFTGPARAAAKSAQRLGGSAGLGSISKGAASASSGMRKAETSVGRFGSALDRVKAKSAAFAGSIKAKIGGMAPMLKTAGSALGGFGLGLAQTGAVLGAGAFTGLIGGVISTGAAFEQFEAQLEGTEGSAKKAKEALSWVLKFAAKTPYEMEAVTEAFVRARNVGIDPFNGAMADMGDAASSNRKTLMDAVEAIADAQTFEFERLKEFNITTSQKDNQVIFSFIDKGGKAAMKTVKKDAESVRQAVLDIWHERHAGAMIRQSKTLVGLWSNIKDTATSFLYKTAQGGFFDKLKEGAAQFLEKLNRWGEDGTLDRKAAELSKRLGEMYDWGKKFVDETDWESVGSFLKVVFDLAAQIGKAIAGIVADVVWLVSVPGKIASWLSGGEAPKPQTGPRTPFPKYGISAEQQGALFGVKVPPARAPGQPAPMWPSRAPIGKQSSVDVNNRLEVSILQPAGMQTRVSGQSGKGLTVTKKVNGGIAMAGSGRAAA